MQLLQDGAFICERDIEAPRSQRQRVVALAYLADGGRVHVGQRLVCVAEQKIEEDIQVRNLQAPQIQVALDWLANCA